MRECGPAHVVGEQGSQKTQCRLGCTRLSAIRGASSNHPRRHPHHAEFLNPITRPLRTRFQCPSYRDFQHCSFSPPF
jgi:hypothetical protein